MSKINVFLRTATEDENNDELFPGGSESETSEIVVPNTGTFRVDNNSQVSPFMAFGFMILFVLVAFLFKRKKRGHRTFFVNQRFNLSISKKNVIRTMIALLVVSVFFGNWNDKIVHDNPTTAASYEALTIATDDIDLNVLRTDGESAYGVVENEITVLNSTENGYILGAYVSGTGIISQNDSSDKIEMITASNSTLGLNTWGMATETPDDQDSQVWNPMPTKQTDAFVIRSVDSSTPDDDSTTIYYGVYVDSSLPDGDYSGGLVNYFAVANVVSPGEYSLMYNANNGSGAPESQTCAVSDSETACEVTIMSEEMVREEHDFLGWADSSSATIAELQDGDLVNLSSNRILYAVWQKKSVTYVLSYDSNGGTGGLGSYSCTTTDNSCMVTLSSSKPIRSGYTFLGWADSNSATTAKYQPGNNISLSANKTIYAVWKKEQVSVTYKLSYNANGGSGAPNAQTCTTTANSCAVILSSVKLTRLNYTFFGWAVSASATSAQYTGSERFVLTKNVTLYAVWKNNYTIRFNGNGSDGGTMSDLPMTYGTPKNLTANSYTRTGYTFVGWNVRPDGSAPTLYLNQQLVNNFTKKPGGLITLYAQWKSQTGKIHFLNVGNSNAFLLESNGHFGLIDASNPLYPSDSSDETTCISDATCVANSNYNVSHVISYLNQIGVRSLDFIIASHSHSDHVGGMPAIAKSFVNSNTRYYYRQYATTAEDAVHPDWHNENYYNRAVNAMRNAGATLIEVTGSEPSFRFGDFTLKLLNTELPSSDELSSNNLCRNDNLNSIVILATIGKKRVLFASDMEKSDETKIGNKVGAVDILQMGHHGSSSSTAISFVDMIKPKDVIIPASIRSTSTREGLQYPAIVRAYRAYNSNIYVTGLVQNAIVASFKDNNYTISDYNNHLGEAKLDFSMTQSQSGHWVRVGYGVGEELWLHIDNNGALDNDWKEIDYNNRTSWFYFLDNGLMATGWRVIVYRGKEQWFYLGQDGRMVTGTATIEGGSYTFDSNGVCIQGSGCPRSPYP